MASVIHRTTLVYLPSVNTPDYPEPAWKHSPDMSQVSGVPWMYWKWDPATERPVEMGAGEKAAVDASIASAEAAAVEDARTAMFPGLVKGDMAAFNGARIKRLPVGADGEILVADSTDPLGVRWSRERFIPVAKTANEIRSATTALANDGALSFVAAANTTYVVRGQVLFETSAAADFKFAINGPPSPTAVRIMRAAIAPGAMAFSAIGVATAFGASVPVTGNGTSGGFVQFSGAFETGSSPGTVAFAWAQNTSDAGNTIVLRGSVLEWARVI